MSDPQTLEEAWFRLSAHPPCADELCSLCEIEEDAARALALAAFQLGRQSPFWRSEDDLQRRIEALGK